MDRKSTSIYHSFIGGNLVTWRSKKQSFFLSESKKQSIVARSVEVDFKAVAHGICELLWLEKLFEDLRIPCKKPMKLYYDNKTTINDAHNLAQHDKTKHVKVDHHFTKDKLDAGLIFIPYVPSEE